MELGRHKDTKVFYFKVTSINRTQRHRDTEVYLIIPHFLEFRNSVPLCLCVQLKFPSKGLIVFLCKIPQKNGQIAKIPICKCVSMCYVWLFLGYLLAILAIWTIKKFTYPRMVNIIFLFVRFL